MEGIWIYSLICGHGSNNLSLISSHYMVALDGLAGLSFGGWLRQAMLDRLCWLCVLVGLGCLD